MLASGLFRTLAVVLACALTLLTNAFAQDPRGSVTGRVLDATSSAVPGAEVRVTNNATGVTAAAKTNDEGRFILPYLPAGEYSMGMSRQQLKVERLFHSTLLPLLPLAPSLFPK